MTRLVLGVYLCSSGNRIAGYIKVAMRTRVVQFFVQTFRLVISYAVNRILFWIYLPYQILRVELIGRGLTVHGSVALCFKAWWGKVALHGLKGALIGSEPKGGCEDLRI